MHPTRLASTHSLIPRRESRVQKRPTPRAILVDLDDTILDDEGTIPACWRAVCADVACRHTDLDAEYLNAAIKRAADWFWSDTARARLGRQDFRATGTRNVHAALCSLGRDAPILATQIYDAYRERRKAAIKPFPGAIEALETLVSWNIRLALVTNGAGPSQRAKIDRFDLARYFRYDLIEGEFGVGKPDARVYRLAMDVLGVRPDETWMVGDNLEWEVATPQKLGLGTVWIDHAGCGVLSNSQVTPDLVIRSLRQLPNLFA